MSRRQRVALGFASALAVACGAVAALLWWTDNAVFTARLGGETIELLAPQFLATLAVAPLIVWGLSLSLADLPRTQRWLGAAARLGVIAALAFALARLARTTDATKISTVFIVDVSDSVAPASPRHATEIVEAAWQARGDNDVQVVTFARQARRVPLDDDAEHIAPLERHPIWAEERRRAGAGSNIEAALQLAYGMFAPGHLRRAVILSDGAQTDGDLLSEAARAREFDVTVYAHAYTEGVPREVAITRVELPERVRVGEPFWVRTHVFSSRPATARVRLYQGETLNGLDSVQDVELSVGDNVVQQRSVVRVAGPVTYAAEVEVEGEREGEPADRFAQNNRFATSVVVPGRPSVLYVEGTSGRASYLASALTAGDFEVDVRSPRAIPTSLRELERFDFFILSDVAADRVSLNQQDVIERYVRDLGGGFLMAGGDDGFGLGGWQGTSVERMLPVRMDAERRRDQPSLALALVIDKSGSMNGPNMELAKEAAIATVELLGPDDYIAVIGFDSQPTSIVRMQSAGNRIRIVRDIGRLTARGGTAIFPALDLAFSELAVTRARVKHVILLTDGQTQEPGIPELVQAMRAESITVSTIGLGSDVNRTLLQQTASVGGGRSYFTQDPHNIPRIFMRETSTVARSNLVEEYFQPTVRHPADFLRRIDLSSAPFLHGYVATRARPSPAQVILMSDLGEPILARWRWGLGWSMAWTSDVKNRWAVDWLRWPGYSRFWSQLVREHMRQRRRRSLDMTAEVIDDEVRVAVNAIGADDQFLNGLTSTVRVVGPLGGGRSSAGEPMPTEADAEEHPLHQTAPGRYEARFALERYGSFVLTAEHQRDGATVAESTVELDNPYPREYMTLEPDVALLRRAAEVTGGSIDPTSAELFDPGEESIRHHEELWPKVIFLALILFVIDLALRRVRFFDRKFRALS